MQVFVYITTFFCTCVNVTCVPEHRFFMVKLGLTITTQQPNVTLERPFYSSLYDGKS